MNFEKQTEIENNLTNKTIVKAELTSYNIELTFSDSSVLTVEIESWGDFSGGFELDFNLS